MKQLSTIKLRSHLPCTEVSSIFLLCDSSNFSGVSSSNLQIVLFINNISLSLSLSLSHSLFYCHFCCRYLTTLTNPINNWNFDVFCLALKFLFKLVEVKSNLSLFIMEFYTHWLKAESFCLLLFFCDSFYKHFIVLSCILPVKNDGIISEWSGNSAKDESICTLPRISVASVHSAKLGLVLWHIKHCRSWLMSDLSLSKISTWTCVKSCLVGGTDKYHQLSCHLWLCNG